MFGTGSGRVNGEENVWKWELKGKCCRKCLELGVEGSVLRKMFGTGSSRFSAEENVWNWEWKGKC
jgi:hypothetical protein